MEGSPETLLQYLTHERLVVDYAYVSAVALLIYDYLLTLHLEVTFVWFSPWNYTKLLFLLTRYLPIINIYFLLHNQLLPDVSTRSCVWTFPVAVWLLMIGIAVAECILMIRTWAVWRRSRKVGIGLAVLMCGSLILECVCNDRFVRSLKLQPMPYPGFRGCYVTSSASEMLSIDFIALTVIELVVLSLMANSAFRAYRSGDNLELSNVIHRDGILYYVYLLCVAMANVVVMLLFPVELKIMLSPLQGVLYSSLTCRIIINIRSVARHGTDVFAELYQETESQGVLSFSPNDQRSDIMDFTTPRNRDSCSSIPLSPV